eukprot:2155810-Prymnesium_polylepis.2
MQSDWAGLDGGVRGTGGSARQRSRGGVTGSRTGPTFGGSTAREPSVSKAGARLDAAGLSCTGVGPTGHYPRGSGR